MDITTIVIAALSGGFFTTLVTKIFDLISGKKNKDSKSDRAIRALLRADILRMYKEYMEQGYCPNDEKIVLHEEYASYHNDYNGNGVATRWYDALMKLPEQL